MSPSVGNFVHDLVEMAKAMETLPLVQSELERYRDMHIDDGDRIARLEQKLIDRANEMDALYAKLRSVEAERDDASFRQLEAEDKVVSVIREVGALQAALRGIEVTLNPPKPEPEPEPVRPIVSVEGESVTNPTASSQESLPPNVGIGSTPTEAFGASTITDASQGESATDPTGSTINAATSESGSLPNVQTPSVSTENVATMNEPPAPKLGKYHGRHYYDIPVYISLTEWLNGGGTIDDYHWRPEPKVAS